MRIQIASDIHTEFHKKNQGRKILGRIAQNADTVDVLVVAGDLSTASGLRYAFSILCDKYKEVVYVAGNHEYYGSFKEETEDILQECCDKHPNLHWLNRSSVEIDGQRFIGSTLWFPNTPVAYQWRNQFSDFNVIKTKSTGYPFSRSFHWILEEFSFNKAHLEKEMREGDILVTHHIPCPEGIHPNWVGEDSNCYFLGDISDVIMDKKPKAAIFGHTHEIINSSLGKTDLICNPVGYPQEGKPFVHKFYETELMEYLKSDESMQNFNAEKEKTKAMIDSAKKSESTSLADTEDVVVK